MGNPNAWAIWSEVTRAIGVARDLSVISDLDCVDSIGDETDREKARRALASAIFVFLDKADKLLPEIEPNLHGVIQ